MVQRICKVCQIPFDFRGGSPMCSVTCRDRWDDLRANFYRIVIAPARKSYDKLTPDAEYPTISQEELKALLSARLDTARVLHSRFLESSNPTEFIRHELPEHACQILGETQ